MHVTSAAPETGAAATEAPVSISDNDKSHDDLTLHSEDASS